MISVYKLALTTDLGLIPNTLFPFNWLFALLLHFNRVFRRFGANVVFCVLFGLRVCVSNRAVRAPPSYPLQSTFAAVGL